MSETALRQPNVPRELLAERALQSTEYALAAARRRLSEDAETIDALNDQIVGLEGALDRALAAPDPLRQRLAATERALRRTEQLAYSERAQREELADELVRLREQRVPLEGVERELGVAQARARRLEAELEIVLRNAAEFEQSAVIAVNAMWRELGAVRSRSALMTEELEELRRRVEGGSQDAPTERAPDAGEPVPEVPQIAPERLEQALSRLRAAAPEPRRRGRWRAALGRLGRWLGS